MHIQNALGTEEIAKEIVREAAPEDLFIASWREGTLQYFVNGYLHIFSTLVKSKAT
jgi:hypothetical protein